MRERADKMVVDRGLAESRQKAQALIMAGRVFSNGKRIEKPGQRVGPDQEIIVKERMPFVSRGGLKLEEALNAFQISVEGKVAADWGSSTGGFTDCLLQRGAQKVYAVDVETRQFDWILRKDPRVVLIEKNARYLAKEDFEEQLDMVTVDLSFISVLKILPALKECLGEGRVVALIKPQFEVGKDQVGKKGLVKDPFLHEGVIHKIIGEAKEMGFHPKGIHRAVIRGQKGNQEFFLWWSLREPPLNPVRLERSIKEAVWHERN